MHKPEARLPDSAEMHAIDQATIQGGVPSIELMRRAGREVYLKIIETLGNSAAVAEILIVCGPGNNGGDGLVIAADFLKDGITPKIIIAAADKYSPDFLIQLQELRQNCEICFYPNNNKLLLGSSISLNKLRDLIKNAHVIIDAMLGTGQKAAPRKPLDQILKLISENTSARKFAVDTPTGACPDSGELLSPDCFKAESTFAVEQIKSGMLQAPLRDFCGEIKTVRIGMDSKSDTSIRMAVPYAIIPERRSFNHHKGTGSKVFVVAGSKRFPGAAVLSATAALKAGAGVVVKVSPECDRQIIQPAELIQINLSGSFLKPLHFKSLFDKKSEDFADISAEDLLLIGPGISQNIETAKFLRKILSLKNHKVLDADALNLLAGFTPAELKQVNLQNSVITPHPQEAARLLNLKVTVVQKNRYLAAQQLFKKYKCAVVLKGGGTIIVNKMGTFVNTTGNPFLATAGSGDVLSGMLVALMAQGLSADQAAISAVVLHGLAGDLAALEAQGAFLAGELSDNFSAAIKELKRIQRPENSKLWTEELVNHALNWPPE